MWFGAQKSSSPVATKRGQVSSPSPASAPNPSASTASLEMPTTIVARGIAPVKAVIESITATQCRLRAVVLLDRSEVFEFVVNLPGQKPVTARGRVMSCLSKPPRFVYTISLDVMAERHVDELARGLAAV